MMNDSQVPGRAGVWTMKQTGKWPSCSWAGRWSRLTYERDYTLLHLAALRGRIRIVQKLLELGADPNAESTSEFTPLDDAREGGHAEIAELLRVRGAARIRNCEGWTQMTAAEEERDHPWAS